MSAHSGQQKHPANWRDFVWIAVIAVAVFAMDMATKVWVAATMPYRPPIEIIPGVFYIGYGENTGIAFGLFQDHGGWLHVITPLAFLILLYLIYKHFAEVAMDGWYLVIFGFLVGGAAGNIFDRLTRGYVVDFLDVYIGSFHWPTFNVADSALTVGQILLIGKLIFWTRDEEESEPEPVAAENATSSESQKQA